MLDARYITVEIGKTKILHGVSFQAKPGEVSAIVGPNGSGKTTLMKAITGELPYTGTVMLNGQDPTRMKPWQLASIRAVLPQASVLAFPFTVIEVVRIGLRDGIAGDQEHLAMEALRHVGLAHFANRFFQELSGGQQQRAQLARVLAQVWQPVVNNVPRWLFLDEPVSSLDIGHQLDVMSMAQDYARAGGGVVAVMHDLNLTALFADHIAILSDGVCAAAGPPEQVMTDVNLTQVYGCTLRVNVAPGAGTTYLLPHMAGKITAQAAQN